MSGGGKWDGFPKSDRPHISPSQLDMYLRCGEQYRRRYVCGEKVPPGVALIKGSGVDAAANRNYKAKLETGEDLPESVLLEAAASGFEEACAQGVFFAADEQPAADRLLGEAKDSAIRMTRTFRREIAPRVQPKLVQPWVRIQVPNASHDLLGRLDVTDADKVVRDLKTSSRRKPQDEIDRSDQMTFYALGYRHLTGERPAGVAMDIVIDTKTPGAQILTSTRDEKDVRVFLHRVNAMIAGIKAGSFPPAALGSWCCSPRFCGYFSTGCPYVNADRRAAAEAGVE